MRVQERDGPGRFGPPRDLAIARSAAVAINDRGDRVLAWPEGRRIAARVRRAGGAWGPAVRFGRLPADRDRRLSAVIAPSGRIVVTWGRDRGHCGVAVRSGTRWRVKRLELRCGSAAVGPRGAPVVPFVDSAGATYVAWTHATKRANSVTIARVGRAGPVGPIVVSRQRGALLDDVAAGPDAAIAVTWAAVLSSTNPLLTATYAAVRRGGGRFTIERISPGGVSVAARQPRRVSADHRPGGRRDPVPDRARRRRRRRGQPASCAVVRPRPGGVSNNPRPARIIRHTPCGPPRRTGLKPVVLTAIAMSRAVLTVTGAPRRL